MMQFFSAGFNETNGPQRMDAVTDDMAKPLEAPVYRGGPRQRACMTDCLFIILVLTIRV